MNTLILFRTMNLIDVFILKNNQSLSYFKLDGIFDDYINHYNKKFDFYVFKCEFEV